MRKLYSIGEVHQMTGFSVSALRYYADMEIVLPEKVDTQTGYRYYSFDDVHRLETVGYLKQAGFSLNEIAEMMRNDQNDSRDQTIARHRQEILHQLESLQQKLELLEWLSHGREEEHPGAEKKTGYQIYQKNFESRRVLLIEADAPCKAEQLHRQICRQWRQLAAAEGYRTTGYLLDEKAFMEQKNLLLDGRFIMPETGEVNDASVISMFPKGTYICMMTPVFRDDRWIRALSRYFTERDIRPRNILTVLKERDLYDWRQSIYEVQILI